MKKHFLKATLWLMGLMGTLTIWIVNAQEINKDIKPNDTEVINVALVVFSILCDAHANEELERHYIIEDMLDTKSDFIYYVNDLIKQTSDTNHSLNRYIEKQLSQESK